MMARKAAVLMTSTLGLVSVVLLTTHAPKPYRVVTKAAVKLREDLTHSAQMPPGDLTAYRLTAKPLPDAPPVVRVAVGDEIMTGDLERRRVTLPDGSVLFVNSDSQVKIATERRVEVVRGEVFVEVVPEFDEQGIKSPFEVVTPQRTVTALGTKFAVTVDDSETDVMVTQGSVVVSGVGEVLGAGQRVVLREVTEDAVQRPVQPQHDLGGVKADAAGGYVLTSAPRAAVELEWTRDLLAAATGPLVPTSEYSGGALVTVDPNGQSNKLSLRKFHVDVHIEDGFARTSIDQTYFNHTWNRLEGTFHFPLPTDASLSRLAMYVNGKLMEGGMAERQHARNTFEQIVHKMQDPALLEWVDGSTFKMRVFPLEPRQEKRIVLSYSQRLNAEEGQHSYRFPAGHTMDAVREWSAHVRVSGGAELKWHSDSHAMTATTDEAGDLLLDGALKNALMDRDFILRVHASFPSLPGKGEPLSLRQHVELPTLADPGAPGDEGVRGESGKPKAESRNRN